MKVRLVVEKNGRQQTFEFNSDRAIIGRAHGNTVRIPSSEVSRQHCRLTVEGGLVQVVDLGSVNGTFLNGQRISIPTLVRPGDQLEIGPVRFRVDYGLSPEALLTLQDMDEPADLVEVMEDDEDLPFLEAIEEEELLEVEAVEELEPVELDAADSGRIAPGFDFDNDGTMWKLEDE